MSADRTEISRGDFGPDFFFGTATSAYQIEGAADEDGKGPSIWDDFCRTKRGLLGRHSRIKDSSSGAIACDHYHRYEEDVGLAAALHTNAYRFSLAWSRILPQGFGQTNSKGIAFYDRLTDALLARGITPFVTLYHWDLPSTLEEKGGWTNRDIARWLADYADVCARALGDRVRHWFVLNEALTFTALGYLFGKQAPGRKWMRNFLPAVHHALLAQGDAARAIKATRPAAEVGTAAAITHAYPHTEGAKDIAAAGRLNALCRIFVDPIVGRGYPESELPFLRKLQRYTQPGDLERIHFPLDFLGINHYFRLVVQHSRWVPGLKLRPTKPPGAEYTDLGWEVFPTALYDVLATFARYSEIPKLYVSENGAAYTDSVPQGATVPDIGRQTYLHRYLREVLRAKQDGINVAGYFVWSLLDNFEWHGGYAHRFGLYHVDYATQQRTLKDSGRWYQRLLQDSQPDS